jgi:hypothetical protein
MHRFSPRSIDSVEILQLWPIHGAGRRRFFLALSTQGSAQGSAQVKLTGLIHHYTAAPDAIGPWVISGEWTAWVKGHSAKADFAASLNMVRSDNRVRANSSSV